MTSKGSNGSFSDSEINLSKSVKNVLSWITRYYNNGAYSTLRLTSVWTIPIFRIVEAFSAFQIHKYGTLPFQPCGWNGRVCYTSYFLIIDWNGYKHKVIVVFSDFLCHTTLRLGRYSGKLLITLWNLYWLVFRELFNAWRLYPLNIHSCK